MPSIRFASLLGRNRECRLSAVDWGSCKDFVARTPWHSMYLGVSNGTLIPHSKAIWIDFWTLRGPTNPRAGMTNPRSGMNTAYGSTHPHWLALQPVASAEQ